MSTGHGNHWECLLKPVEEAIERFIAPTLASGKLESPVRRSGLWFDRDKMSEETVSPIICGTHDLRILALVVSDTPAERNVFYSAYPFAAKGGKLRLQLTEVRDWGNEIEGVLVGETEDGSPVAFFDSLYFRNRDAYRVGESYDFQMAGLIYSVRCTNEETIDITDEERIAMYASAWGKEPERLPNGKSAPVSIHLAGCTGYAGTSDEYPEDAEFYCVIEKVAEFQIEGVRIFQITPRACADEDENVPLPQTIFGAESAFAAGYIPKVGDSIGGGLWTQGFLSDPKKQKSRRGKQR